MNENSVAAKEITVLKKKLDNAITSRADQGESFKAQSSLLIQFINKLSYVSKGIDLELDNRLAKLRTLLSKSAPFADIEQQIQTITKLLRQHSVTNENNINIVHKQFHLSGSSLQKVKGLPDKLRRELRELLKKSEETKSALVQYNPFLIQLLGFYKTAIQAKTNTSTQNQAQTEPQLTIASVNTDKTDSSVNPVLLEKISTCLNSLHLSEKNTKALLSLKAKLLKDTSNQDALAHFIEIFDVVVADLIHERDSAKTFLNSLSNTLTSVQDSVKKTLATCNKSQNKQDVLNVKLQKQIVDMTDTVDAALSLDQVKVDINEKLQQITDTLKQKSKHEVFSQTTLVGQLKNMADKVYKLEVQSNNFEKMLKEQQIKSMQDALTKLNNRAAFDEYFAKTMVKFHHKPTKLAIAVLDLDDFKRINDTYGHSAGDKTLKVIANTLTTVLGDNVFIARYGGEEFVLIYESISKNELLKELNKLKVSVASLPFKFKNDRVSMTMSIGAYHLNSNDNVHTAFENADNALYQAKAKGKNQVIYYGD